ncbi:efflux RND transporter periplasmic adaptor subunit [Bacillus alkalicellulosilyticus]|uniref:efflux RND transporter periplasmic adaptor subunit n=1 Tax=Alkalihalobacterium alkalicellulosilyticum TaxID=1912214 RepID=UPI00099742E6|nr:efflux RND transporter periplasmic adaptor subunit [Bacillus alkalicellulosilyticus]
MTNMFSTSRIVLVIFVFLFVISACSSDEITNEGQERTSLLVDVSEVTESTIKQTLELTGQALPQEQIPLFTTIPLEVTEVAKQVGDSVTKGDLIISLNDEEARRQINQAKDVVKELENAVSQAEQLNRTTERNIEELRELEAELQQSLQRSQEMIENLSEDSPEQSLLEFIQHSLELSMKQAQLSQAAGAIQQTPPINMMELDMQLAQAKENVRQAEQALQATELTAPIDGVIAQLDVIEGQTALPNSPLATVVVLDPVIATFSANQYQVGKIFPDMETEVTIDGLNLSFDSTISVVSPVVDPQTNTFLVQIPLENQDLRIRGGMRTTALIDLDTIEEALVIPVDSILYDDTGSFVYLAEDTEARRQDIVIGSREQNLVEVLEGLAVGDRVITTGKERVTDGAQITIRNE